MREVVTQYQGVNIGAQLRISSAKSFFILISLLINTKIAACLRFNSAFRLCKAESTSSMRLSTFWLPLLARCSSASLSSSSESMILYNMFNAFSPALISSAICRRSLPFILHTPKMILSIGELFGRRQASRATHTIIGASLINHLGKVFALHLCNLAYHRRKTIE